MKRQLKIHGIPPELTKVLEPKSHRRGASMAAKGASNGLAQLAGTWSEEEYAEFEAALATMEQID